MEFEFDKFVVDIEKRQHENREERKTSHESLNLDRQRRLRSERYHERWQNRIVWEKPHGSWYHK